MLQRLWQQGAAEIQKKRACLLLNGALSHSSNHILSPKIYLVVVQPFVIAT